MKILCAYSGIEFSCEHFPLGLYARESFHPIFNVPQRKLLTTLPKWSSNELTSTDSYLLFLSLLSSSDLIEFRTSAKRTDKTDSIVAQNMEGLVKTLVRLNTVSNPAVVFPHYVVSQETNGLENVHFWIENWQDSYKDFLDGYKSAHDLSKLNKREGALERLIKNPHKSLADFAHPLADWAATAGSFPTSMVQNPFTKMSIPLAEYWKILIIKCANNIDLFSIHSADLAELIEHCETEIPHGSIHAHHLMKALRDAQNRQRNFLDIGDLDLNKTKFSILDKDSNTMEANMQALISSAPENEPQRASYPTKFDYMKAKMRWDMARKAQKKANDES